MNMKESLFVAAAYARHPHGLNVDDTALADFFERAFFKGAK